MKNKEKLGASFRDPNGFIFSQDGILYRQVNKIYKENYDLLKSGKLYKQLIDVGLLISHTEVDLKKEFPEIDKNVVYKILKPAVVPFISYPYEWSFSMLKDAALTTLKIQKIALENGMTLKDATAFNIQFIDAKPVFIDTLSFEKYEEGEPWVAYQQFCKHFLAPLALMSYVNIELGKLFQIYLDGIPLDLAAKLLPLKGKLNMGLMLHLLAHASSQTSHSKDSIKGVSQKSGKVSKLGLLGIIDSLESTIKNLKWNLPETEWGDYYSNTNYTPDTMDEKSKLVEKFILETKPKKAWDLGGNTGKFSRLASRRNIFTVSSDIDPVAVELNYLDCKKGNDKNLLPILQDLTNISANIGFANNERASLIKRGPVDTVLALALIHHMAISNNLPFEMLAEFFAQCGKYLIIEFVPKSDSQVKILLFSRKDIFPGYEIENFKAVFGKVYDIKKEKKIADSERVLFLMERKQTYVPNKN